MNFEIDKSSYYLTDYRYTSELSVANDPNFINSLLSPHGKSRAQGDQPKHAKPQQRNNPYRQHDIYRPAEDSRYDPYRQHDHYRPADDYRYDTYRQSGRYSPTEDSRYSTYRQHGKEGYREDTRYTPDRNHPFERPHYHGDPQPTGSRRSLEKGHKGSKKSLLSRIS